MTEVLRISEKDWSQTVYDLARVLDWRAVRFPTWRATSTTPGFPDLVMVRGRRLIFAELKRDMARPTAAQMAWLNDLDQIDGVEVYLWRPSDWEEVKEVLSYYGDRNTGAPSGAPPQYSSNVRGNA